MQILWGLVKVIEELYKGNIRVLYPPEGPMCLHSKALGHKVAPKFLGFRVLGAMLRSSEGNYAFRFYTPANS